MFARTLRLFCVVNCCVVVLRLPPAFSDDGSQRLPNVVYPDQFQTLRHSQLAAAADSDIRTGYTCAAAGDGAAQQVGGAVYIGVYEGIGVCDAPVYMTFSRKMDHGIRMIFFKNRSEFFRFGNVRLFENIIGFVLYIL